MKDGRIENHQIHWIYLAVAIIGMIGTVIAAFIGLGVPVLQDYLGKQETLKIKTFKADKTEINPGEYLRMEWNVEGADEVFLNVGTETFTVDPQGSRAITPNESLTVQLLAKAESKTKTASHEIIVRKTNPNAPPTPQQTKTQTTDEKPLPGTNPNPPKESKKSNHESPEISNSSEKTEIRSTTKNLIVDPNFNGDFAVVVVNDRSQTNQDFGDKISRLLKNKGFVSSSNHFSNSFVRSGYFAKAFQGQSSAIKQSGISSHADDLILAIETKKVSENQDFGKSTFTTEISLSLKVIRASTGATRISEYFETIGLDASKEYSYKQAIERMLEKIGQIDF